MLPLLKKQLLLICFFGFSVSSLLAASDEAIIEPIPGSSLIERVGDDTFSLVYFDVNLNSQTLGCGPDIIFVQLFCSLRYEQLVHPQFSVMGLMYLPSSGPRLGVGTGWYPIRPFIIGLGASAYFHFAGTNSDADWTNSGSGRVYLISNIDLGRFTTLTGFRLSLHFGYSRNLLDEPYNFAFTNDSLDSKSGTGVFLEIGVGLAF